MKKTLSSLLALILTFSVCFGLISCDNTNNPSNDNPTANTPGGDNPNTNKPFNVDLAGYVANIGNATALGISKKAKSSASTMASYGTNHSGIQLLSYNTLASDKDTEDKSYIVMSTTDYDANAPEADKTGLTKVTFTKIVTENATTEITGTKLATAKHGKISISATHGFTYSLYQGETLIQTQVADNGETDKPNKKVHIVFEGLTDGVEYKVNYKGIGVETTITQDEINGEIDKLCVMNGYTFISFVPQGESLRPEDKYLDFDNNGIANYDKTNYFSNTNRQSFVIDNSTGLVYHIKDTQISEIKNNLLIINNKVFDMMVNDNNELQFAQVVQNETIQIYDFFKDKYGQKYILNDTLDFVDYQNKTLYYRDRLNYILSKEGIGICLEATLGAAYDGYSVPEYYTSIKKVTDDFNIESITQNERYTLECTPFPYDNTILSHIENGYLYQYTRESYGPRFARISVLEENPTPQWIGNYPSKLFYAIDYNSIIIGFDVSGTFCIFYIENVWKDISFISDGMSYSGNGVIYNNGNPEYDNDKIEILISNCVDEHNYNTHIDINQHLFKVVTIKETIYYQIIIDENGVPKAVNSETYVAPEQEIITLQPINN